MSTSFRELLVGNSDSRKFLQPAATLLRPQAPAIPPALEENITFDNNFDNDGIIVLSVLVCAVICLLGFFCVARCALNCSSLVAAWSGAKAKSGVKQKVLKTFLTLKYTANKSGLPAGMDTTCVICLSEFALNEVVRILPKCSHGFHVGCIDRWLSSNSSCPTCRHCLVEVTCQRIVKCSQASPSELPLSAQENTRTEPTSNA